MNLEVASDKSGQSVRVNVKITRQRVRHDVVGARDMLGEERGMMVEHSCCKLTSKVGMLAMGGFIKGRFVEPSDGAGAIKDGQDAWVG